VLQRKFDLNIYLGQLLKNPLVLKSDVLGGFLLGNFAEILATLKTYAAAACCVCFVCCELKLVCICSLDAPHRYATEKVTLSADLKAAKEKIDRLEADLKASRADCDQLKAEAAKAKAETTARLAHNAQLQVL
jgi:hypothetical protein